MGSFEANNFPFRRYCDIGNHFGSSYYVECSVCVLMLPERALDTGLAKMSPNMSGLLTN